MSDFRYDKDAGGIVTVTMDMEGQSANTMNDRFITAMSQTVARLQEEDGLCGVIFASAKKSFFAGGDLKQLLAIDKADDTLLGFVEMTKAPLRALEKLPVPVIAAINGAALGGGYELCLACNRRIIVNEPHAVTGLPEVSLGLLPGAGGVVRLTALLGLEKALPLLLEGKQLRPDAAKAAGMVDDLVASQDELIPAAIKWIKANPGEHAQPWDRKGFEYPGGGADAPNVRMAAMMAPTMLMNKTRGLMPAPEKILDIAVNSMRMGFDSALRVESRGITALIPTRECKAAISTFFFGMQAIKSGKVRPEGERWQAKSSAILGAGMMGAGIAWAHASRGLPAVLKDMEQDKADKGKAYSAALADKQIKRGRMNEAKKQALLGLIKPTTRDADYAGTDIIIEAVFEDIDLKDKVIPETFKQLGPSGIYGSNTSTLPISILAKACPDPSRFIGLHFFSPVDKMQLVEIIVGEKTSDDTLRKAYDYVQQIGKLPIVVNDARGFFTSRVFGTYMDEGQSLLQDGMSPVAIERAAWKIGMPVGPLAVHDEVSQVLSKKAYETHAVLDKRLGADSGFGVHNTATKAVGIRMADMNRGGRRYGGGFYNYHADGSKSLWDGLSQFVVADRKVPMRDAEDRLIYRQAIETLRCFDEGVLRSQVEANIGSIFGIGFPPHTGGALQFIHGAGIDAFAARAGELAAGYGERFAVTDAALDKLRNQSAKAA